MQQNRVGIVMRTINTEIPTFEQLQLPSVLKDLSLTKRGLIIVVGATGSGKSNTLAAVVGHRNEMSHGHIVTIEDPVEYVHQHRNCIVTHREVGVDTESWEVALKNTLRQAPDVIMIGEIRDRETMEHAVAFAETGHLCLATLHSNNADQTIERILNFFPEAARLAVDLSLNLKAIVSQRDPDRHRQGRDAGSGDPAELAADRRPDLQGRSARSRSERAANSGCRPSTRRCSTCSRRADQLRTHCATRTP